MKNFAIFAAVLCLAAAVRASGYGGGAAASAGGGYGGASASIPAPPCPKNYIFSCAPNLSPVPCSSPGGSAGGAGGYGGAGAYSQYYPVYSFPQFNNEYENKQSDN